MATRAITTNQPEVSCDVCGRRLLRGERPDVFLASGSRRVVCELCIPRATGEGWLRESEALTVTGARGSRTRRGRSLLDRLRQRRGVAEQQGEVAEQEAAWPAGRSATRRRAREDSWQDAPAGGWAPEQAYWQGEAEEPPVQEGDTSWSAIDAAVEPATHEQALPEPGQDAASGEQAPHQPALESRRVAGARQAQELVRPRVSAASEQAIEVFNASECSTRVAGIARSLGQPSVTVGRVAERDRVAIVIAWELCWYRYEIDLSQAPATIGLIGEGAELDELPAEDRLSNAVADERGELSLLR